MFEPHSKFVEVLLPVPLNRTFTYSLPEGATPSSGVRVVVPFNRQKFLTGIIVAVHEKVPDYETKPISEILDDAPIMSTQQLEFINWMATYYMCTAGEVLNAALPSGLKISSESTIQLHPQFIDVGGYTDLENLVIDALATNHVLSYTEIRKIVGHSINKVIKQLDKKNIITISEEAKEKYSPKTEKYIRFTSEYLKEKNIELLFEQLASKPKQEEVLLAYLQESGTGKLNTKGIKKKLLKNKGISLSSLNTLIRNNIFEEYEITISRFEEVVVSQEAPILSEDQQKALQQILDNFDKKDNVLLHGITGSGKTAIYIHLIKQILENGHQALLLLPEIALTTQIVGRLQKVFGDKMGVYHSRFSENERVEVWKGVLSGKYQFIVGVRSSVFLPFDDLGLVIIDEEHETSYKQYEPAPRYHARDAALMMAKIHNAKTLLGSATPSMESYFQAEGNKYGYVKLDRRYGDAELPTIQTIDFGKAIKQRKVKGNFTDELLGKIEKAIAEKQQVIIFQNRRGFAPFLECQNCGWVPKCINCAVSLTYHQYQQQLRCHYCGYHEKMPSECDSCSSTLLKTMGFGTEKLENDLQLLLPDINIQRMDLETTRSKNSYHRIIEDFANRKTDVLIGTQMVTKGLDFENVAVVGVVDFDRMLHFPDFRSYERTFDLTLQVSGRAGRSSTMGEVFIQTYNPGQPIFILLKNADYAGFFQKEQSERARFNYPPFTRLIKVIFKHRDKQVVLDCAKILAARMRDHFDNMMVLGPEAPMINRIKNKYLMELTLKLPRKNFNLAGAKEIVRHESLLLQNHPEYKTVQIVFDVDPY